MKKALFIGRFQPFHLGHLSVIEQALKENDFLYIGIGSAEDSFQPYNPFTAAERFLMIEESLKDAGISASKYAIIPIRNINNFPLWVEHVKLYIPEFSVVYTGSPIVEELFQKADPKMTLKNVPDIFKGDATVIREKIRKGESIEDDVTPATLAVLDQIDAHKRVTHIHSLTNKM